MILSELIATLHNEVAKSYNFINETKGVDSPEKSILHLNIDLVEFDIPAKFTSMETTFKQEDLKTLPNTYKKLYIPFSPFKSPESRKPISGNSINAELINETDKLDSHKTGEVFGRIKIVFKPIIG